MADASRSSWFDSVRERIAEYYLADPDNQYQQSGRSTGAARWEETRRCIADGVDRSGSFLDVGCANGLLLESVATWVAERGLEIEPHGIDFVPELVALAQMRIPHGVFTVANVWDWTPSRQYTFVRTSVEYVPHEDRSAFVQRQRTWVQPGGRLIVCWYPDRGEEVDLVSLIESIPLPIGGVLRPHDHVALWLPA